MADFQFQDLAIEEQQGIERLRLGRGGDTSYCREMIDEGNDAGRANGTWVLRPWKWMYLRIQNR